MQATPAEIAKQFAKDNGFTIVAKDRRYVINYRGAFVAEVGGYPAAYNAMTRHMSELSNALLGYKSAAMPRVKLTPPDTHIALWRYAHDSATHRLKCKSYADALKAIRQRLSNPILRPVFVNIQYIGA
jgi:hypothetical protein